MQKAALPRGVRNHNPGNIRISGSKWRGKVEGKDEAFETFVDHIHGLRALMKLLQNYQTKYGLDTIEQLIPRWAPDNENNTDAYIKHVSEDTNIPKDKKIDLQDRTTLIPIAQAIVLHENGHAPDTHPHYWYDIEDYHTAYEII